MRKIIGAFLYLMGIMAFLSACGLIEEHNARIVADIAATQLIIPTDIEEIHEATGVIINYDHHHILKVSERPLFARNGSVNQDVLYNLMAILNDPLLDPMLRQPKDHWPGELPFNGPPYIATTAEDFSRFILPEPTNMNYSGAIIIKLFEPVPEKMGIHNGHVTELTNQWWQLVYRGTDNDKDVLTLWMMQPYRLTPFNGTRYHYYIGSIYDRYIDRLRDPEDGIWNRIPPGSINTVASDDRLYLGLPPRDDFFFEGNYSESIARANLLRDKSFLLDVFDIEQYLVAPRNLPGRWQSSAFQTGANVHMVYYASGEFYTTNAEFPGSTRPNGGLGATGLIWSAHSHFALINGKDGLSIGPYYNHFPNTNIVPTHYDLLWLPSDFEVRTMGFNKDNAVFQTFLTDPDDPATILRTNTEPEPRPDNANGRSGLWRLNGFDRAFDIDGLGLPRGWITEQIWLRSADNLGIGNANTVSNTGNRYGYGVNQLAGMRPGIHLSLTDLN